MKVRIFFAAPLVAVAIVGLSLGRPVLAQYDSRTVGRIPDEWENHRIRLSRITADPGSAISAAAGDRVLVYLTADPEGRLPPAAAVWQPAGSGDLQNRGRASVEAIAIELKDAQAGSESGTAPEAFVASRRADMQTLIDNPRVLVTKHRYAPATYVDPLHFHPEDILVVYLRGGDTWPAVAGWGSYRVRRGEVDIVPANTLHTFGNAGSDPLEFLVISPR